ncbi:hypothetical protein [Actinomadura sp. KC06]|uniref:WXG100 family type VII secretion target n=1 Tax=Actinomadura sp. KC06 TaxID=2530369 RepID=UPI001404B1AF|nr:hypothetical protein [Actinomadura sp. KC06]
MGDKQHDQPIRATTDNGQEWSGDMDAMNRLLESINSERVIKAGSVYKGTAAKFEGAAGDLGAQISALARVWKGDDAEATIRQLQKLQKSAEVLKQVSQQTATALSSHGEKLQWYEKNQPKEGFFKGLSWDDAGVVTGGTLLGGAAGGLAGLKVDKAFGLIKDKESEAAVEHMKRLSERTREANAAMPERVRLVLPSTNFFRGDPRPGGGGLPGGGGGNLPGGGSLPSGGGSIPGGLDGVGNSGDGTMHGGGYGGGLPGGGTAGSDLAGLPGGGGGADPFGRGGLGGGLPGGGGGGGLPGGGAGGLVGGLPGAGAGAGVGAGRGGTAGGGKGLGKGGSAGRGGMGGMPMGAGRGGGGGGEDEHERTTWLTEDEDVWGGNDEDAAPPVIG